MQILIFISIFVAHNEISVVKTKYTYDRVKRNIKKRLLQY